MKEVKGCGIAVEDPTELEQLIEDLVQVSEEAELKFINETEVSKKSQIADQARQGNGYPQDRDGKVGRNPEEGLYFR